MSKKQFQQLIKRSIPAVIYSYALMSFCSEEAAESVNCKIALFYMNMN